MSFRDFLNLFLKASGESEYRSAIRSAVRGLWSGELDYSWFYDAMLSAIRFHIPQAWFLGAKECGILAGELTQEEKAALEQAIQYELQWINGFATAIEEGSKENGGKLSPLFSRAEIWIGRWNGVKSKAMAMACADQKLEWVLGPTDTSCSSCLKLAGKVKRSSYWNKVGVLPRQHGSELLACRGFRCLCEFQVTDEPASKGPLPSLP